MYPKSYRSPPKPLDQINEKLFISDCRSAASKELLDNSRITHILIVGAGLAKKFPNDYQYHYIPVDDSPDEKMTRYFKEAFDFIEKGERVLVHCAAGISRSSSMAIAYLMMKNKWDYQTAHDLVKKARPAIYPNHGFISQLKELEKTFKPETKKFDFESIVPSRVAIDKINDKLYISDATSAADKQSLDNLKITHILMVGNYLQKRFPDNFVYRRIPVDDSPDQILSNYFQEAYDFIEKGDCVLVHCAAGISRSAAMVIAYLMLKNKWDYTTAHDFVKKVRPNIYPNYGFINQLKELEKTFESL